MYITIRFKVDDKADGYRFYLDLVERIKVLVRANFPRKSIEIDYTEYDNKGANCVSR